MTRFKSNSISTAFQNADSTHKWMKLLTFTTIVKRYTNLLKITSRNCIQRKYMVIVEFTLMLIIELNMIQQEIRNYVRDSERKCIGYENNLRNCITDIERKNIYWNQQQSQHSYQSL